MPEKYNHWLPAALAQKSATLLQSAFLEVYMPASAILLSQKNEILRLLTEKGFSPNDFLWEDGQVPGDGGCLPVKLIHQPSGFFCSFAAERSDSGNPYIQIEYSPSEEGFITSASARSAYQWDNEIKKWIDILRREIDTPDLWTSIVSGQSSVMQATATASENTPFTPPERAQVIIFLGEIRTYIQTNAGLSPDKFSIVIEKLAYLEQAADRMGRKDWLNLFLGVLFSMAMQVAMEKSVFQDLLSVAGHLFRQFLRHIILLPLPSY
jgi:hypothetical protein